MTPQADVQPDWRARLKSAGLATPKALLNNDPACGELAGSWELLSKPGLRGRERWRWEFENGGGEPRVVYVKRYRRLPLARQWDRIVRQTFGPSVGWWELAQGRRLADLRIPVAAPVAYAEQMSGPLEARSAVLLEGARGEAFDRYWRRRCQDGHPLTRGVPRHDMTRRLARFAAAFHETGFRHRDLYLCHIFVEHDEAGRASFRLIDLARTFRPWLRRTRWLIKDLSQLDVSARQIGATRADRLRFLLTYLGLQRLSPRVRSYARRTTAKADGVLRRIARKGG